MAQSSFGKKVRDMWWPHILDISSARKAALYGFGAAAYCSVVTGMLAAFGWLGVTMDAMWAAVSYSIIAWGIFKMARIASVAGLLLYLSDHVYAWSQQGTHPNPAMAIFTLMFITGVLGSFYYHRFRKQNSNVSVGPFPV